MNFEIIDNFCQAGVLTLASVTALIQSLRFRSRECLILSFAYAGFAMGTLYWGLYITIVGNIPRAFYVSEILWISSYFFYITFQQLRSENVKFRFSVKCFLPSLLIAEEIIRMRIMGPAYIVSGLFAFTAGILMYLSLLRLSSKASGKKTDILFVVCILLQIALYVSSAFMEDFLHFNVYFLIDIVLTFSYVGLLPLTICEVKEK